MFRFVFCAFLVFSASSASADSATQNDWSGGPGVYGPVTSFGDEFYSDSGVECFATSGGVSLDLIDQVWAHDVGTSYNGAVCALAADIDGDGDMDVVSAAEQSKEVTWWENADGSGTTWIEHTIDDDFYKVISVCPGDLDSDGDVDVGACSGWMDGVAWWENLDGAGDAWSKHIIDADFLYARDICSADVDGDGNADLLSTSADPDQIAWWRNQGGTFGERNLITEQHAGHAYCVCTGDIDNDGDNDVVGNTNGAEISWWENLDQAGTAWEKHLVAVEFQNVQDVQTADLDGDGDLDVIGAAYAGILDDVSWWENLDGVGESWDEHIIDGDFWGARSVDAADMDEDGDMDVMGAASYESDITWWENLDASGSSWTTHVIDGLLGGARHCCAVDMDGDGIEDVLGAGYLEDIVVWYDIKTYPPEGWLESSILDVSCSPDWGMLDWMAETPAGTSVSFQVRSSTSPDSGSMGPWSDTIQEPCSLDGVLPDGDQYVQYRAILLTEDTDITPSLQSVTITWNPLGACGGLVPSGYELLPVHPNPGTGAIEVEFCVPVISLVELMVFDMSGRLVITSASSEYSPGFHGMVVGDLLPGVFICLMRAGEFASAQRFVVLE